MIDIFPPTDEGLDLGQFDTTVARATNVLSVQIGSLEYAQTLGIDLKFFLASDFRFQDDSFKAYCIQVLAYWGINVSELSEAIDKLFAQYTFKVQADESSTSLIAR